MAARAQERVADGGRKGSPTRSAAGASVAPARVCAYTVLRRVFEHGAYADLALRAQARGLDARDRALAMRLAYGAVQRRGTLDHLIERLAERPLRRLDTATVAALRLGLYELLCMDGAPDYAVVADAVELAKGAAAVGRGAGAGRDAGAGQGAGQRAGARPGRAGHGLVNAVLRRATREGEALLAALDDDTPEGAALKHSHPLWLAQLWWNELGAEEARALMAFDNEPAELALRVNTLIAEPATVSEQLLAVATVGERLPTSAGPRPVGVRRDPFIPEALVLEGPWDVHGSPQWRSGAVLAQSRAAMLAARALAPAPGERVLDLCAAPGGKTTHLAALMEGEGEVVAVERNPRRAAELRRTVERLGARECVRVMVADAAAPAGTAGPVADRVPATETPAPFDRVLVDPPCSGLGTLQARADLRWRVTPEDLPRLARTQAAILAAGAAAVRPGGVLVYSTCTISASENERQIAAFLESKPDFALDDLGAELCDRSGIGRRRGGGVLTLPNRDRTAGFFIARLRRS
jgi:16S rRNA (cytosine967-C5)-methyltransferase